MGEGNPILRFQFVGGDADNNTLDFYDSGRFLYGAARLVYGLEHYRQKEKILQKISTKINVDLQVRGAQPGSSIWDIVLLAAPLLADCALKVPLEAVVSHILGKLFRTDKASDDAVAVLREISKQRSADTAAEIARQATNLETQKNLGRLIDVVGNLIAKEGNTQIRGRLQSSMAQLSAEDNRRKLNGKYQGELEAVPDGDIERLLQKYQPAVLDIGRPVMRSAENLNIFDVANDNARPVFVLDRGQFVGISGDKVDDLPTPVRGVIKRYDKEMGWGQFRNPEIGVVGFQVPSANKNEQLLAILNSMAQDDVFVSFYFVRSKLGAIRYLILDRLIEEDEE